MDPPVRSPQDIRRLYEETTHTLGAIAALAGISRHRLSALAEAGGWRRPADAPTRRSGLKRGAETRAARERPVAQRPARRQSGPGAGEPVDLPSMVSRLIRVVAAMVTRAEDGAGTIDERDARALGALAATLARVVALSAEARQDGDGRSAGADGPHIDDPRVLAAFSDRLEQVAASLAAADPGADDAGATQPADDFLAALRAGRPAGA